MTAICVCLVPKSGHQGFERRTSKSLFSRCKTGHANLEYRCTARLIPEHRVFRARLLRDLRCGARAEALRDLLSPWHTPSKWISDPQGYVFLPRAMLEIGKALYPSDWTGAEPTTPVFLPLPLGSATARQSEKQEAHIALCKERPEFGRKPLSVLPQFLTLRPRGGLSASGGPIIPPFTNAEWQAAREIYRRREDAARPAWSRFAQVKKTVTDACRQGQLAFGLRPRAGGAVYPGKKEWWETEGVTLHYRFEWFRISSAAPFANGLRDDADWICIARDSLDALLRRLSPSHAGATTAKGESDAIRHLADKLKENPGMTREEASAECAHFGISKRGLLNRVFPKAREKAGLPARASAGRKRNNRSAKSKR